MELNLEREKKNPIFKRCFFVGIVLLVSAYENQLLGFFTLRSTRMFVYMSCVTVLLYIIFIGIYNYMYVK